jgi:hypothetical protein
MKKSLLLFILVLCVNFTSCNKDDLEERNEELIIQIASLQRQLNDLSEDFSDLLTDNENKSTLIEILHGDTETVIKLGCELNRLGYYFEAHEVIEKYWLNYKGEYKKFLQALIQVAIANMHYKSGNLKGYNRMKELALGNLKPYSGKPFGIDLQRLKNNIETAEGIIDFPC